MRVLLTGATGLIGNQVGYYLTQAGHKVAAVTRAGEGARKRLSYPCQIIRWADYNELLVDPALAGVEGVINLAGESIDRRWTKSHKAEIYNSRVLRTRMLVRSLLASPGRESLRVFVGGSATGLYGDRRDALLDEKTPAGSDFLATVVQDWEAEARALHQFAPQIRVTSVRTAMVLAPHGGALEKLLPVFEHGFGSVLGDGAQFMSWIHLDDIARLFVFALESEKCNLDGAINGAAGAVTNKEFTCELNRLFKKTGFLPVPKFALRLGLGEMADAVLFSIRASTANALDLGFKFKYPILSEALSACLAARNTRKSRESYGE